MLCWIARIRWPGFWTEQPDDSNQVWHLHTNFSMEVSKSEGHRVSFGNTVILYSWQVKSNIAHEKPMIQPYILICIEFEQRRITHTFYTWPLRWRHNEHNEVSTQQHLDGLLNRLFRRRSKKISKLRVTGLFLGEFTGEFRSQRTSKAQNVSIWWRHRAALKFIVSEDKELPSSDLT